MTFRFERYYFFVTRNKNYKFIPCYISENFSFMCYINYFFEDFLKNFNKKTFFFNINRDKQPNSNTLNSSDQISMTQFQDCPINILIKKLFSKKSGTTRKYPLLRETIDLEFYKEWENNKWKPEKNNITLKEFISIRKFIKNKPNNLKYVNVTKI